MAPLLDSLVGSRLLIRVFGCAVFLLYASGVGASGPGLYKDGEKILGFEAFSDSAHKVSDEPRPWMDTAGNEYFREVFPKGAPEQFTIRKQYLHLVIGCRDLVQGRSSNASSEEQRVEELLKLEQELRQVNRRLLDRLSQVGQDLRQKALPAEKLKTHDELVERHNALADRLLHLLDELRQAHETGSEFTVTRVLQELDRYFRDNEFRPPPRTYNYQPSPTRMQREDAQILELSEPPPSIPYPTMTTRTDRDYDPADLDPTIDVQFSDEIVALADSLGHSPVAMYNYVREHCEYQPYLGSRKGSQQTLTHGGGNDYDQASLLIALLRVSGVPGRYAAGNVKMEIDEALSWLGMRHKVNAANLLATAGLNPTLYIVGPDTVALGCDRVWVEAWLPFASYRGAPNDSAGYAWVPMDPVFKQYSYDLGINLPEEIGFDGEAFVDDYISGFQPETPLDVFRQMLIDALPVHHPGATYEDLFTTRRLVRETDGILPGTLPYELLVWDGTFSEIPAAMRYKIEFRVGGTSLVYGTSLPEIVEKQVTISYVGATPADQQLIDDAGGIFYVEDPYLVNLLPVLKIDGCEVARGTSAVMMGTTQTSDMHFTTPEGDNNEIPVIYNLITAGNYQGIGIDTEDALPAYFEEPETTCDESRSGQEAHQLALTYLHNVDLAGDEIADLMHLVVINDVSEAIVENTVNVYFEGELPVEMEWTGMIVDADRKIVGPFSVDGVENSCDYMRLAGADGSIQENRLFEVRFDEEAISAIKILELASDSLIQICRIESDIDVECPGFDHSPSVRQAVQACLDQGREVIIPERSFTYYEWSGTGWICIDPETCAAGYIIAGGHNGGATVRTWGIPWYLWFFGIVCTKAHGPVTVDPPAANDMYCADSWASWTFHVPQIDYYQKNDQGDCSVLVSWPRDFHVWYPIWLIAWIWGPGEYVFRAGGPSSECAECTPVEKRVTIVKIGFQEEDFLVYRGKTGQLGVTVEPASASGSVTFESVDPATATVSGTPPNLTVTGVSEGETSIKAKLNSSDCADKDITVFSVAITTPNDDPVGSPNATNERVFSTAATGILTVDCAATPNPNTGRVQNFLKNNKLRWTVGAVGGSALTWNSSWPGDATKGEDLSCTAQFSGLPANNSDFGLKQVMLEVLVDGSSVTATETTNIEVFYPGTATNHPGGTSTHPNWFHYYKQNAGGGPYGYEPSGRSHGLSAGGLGSVMIGNEAYDGDSYITTTITAGQLTATGWSGTNRYYANFLGVLAHETQHATNQTNAGPPTDRDSDRLTNDFETNTSSTDPDNAYSARGVLVGNVWTDREVYAGGPVEEGGINGANTAQDWASPGTNKN